MPDLPTLPILERRREIEEAIRANQVIVLCGQTGSGKTTQLPQICLEMGLAEPGGDRGRGGRRLIGHTQPRRLAARAVAARIAEERGERLGETVGVKVRFQDHTGARTRIKLMTDGILLAELAGDPLLSDYSVLIIDEAHERSVNIDVLLGAIRQLLPGRPDLKVIITSATIDPGRFSGFFAQGERAAPVIEVSGRMFPVEVRYSPPGRDDEDDPARLNPEAIADAVEELARPSRPPGDVLVFLPGEREIRLAADAVSRRQLGVEVLPLFSRLTDREQDRIFHPPTPPTSATSRRVVLATNIAETSLTVPGIRYVVDTGLARLNRYDPERKLQRLPVEMISRASAEQRSGRCGRVAAGVCIRLYSEAAFAARPAFTDPEIRRSSLAGVILRLRSIGVGIDVESFPFLDPPTPQAIRDGYDTLFELGAISEAGPRGEITEIGRRMSRFPLDVRIARMLLAAESEGCLAEVTVLAGALSIQDPRQRPLGREEHADRAQQVFRHESSDFLTLLRLYEQFAHAADGLGGGELINWCRERYLAPARMREWVDLSRQIAGVAEEMGLHRNEKAANPDALHRALLAGLISNVACREGDGSFNYRGVWTGKETQVQIHPGSVLFKKGPKWIMAAELVHTSRLFARTVARIEPEWIEAAAGHVLRRQRSDAHLDPATGVPSAWERVTMGAAGGVVVVPRRRAELATVDPAAARRLFVAEALAQCKWQTDAPFMAHNRGVLARAKAAEARLRRRNVMVSDEELAAWFEVRVPPGICEPVGLTKWLAEAQRRDPSVLRLPIDAVVRADARAAFDPAQFPEQIEGGPVQYALAPGKDEDGVTLTIELARLPEFPVARAPWLVPGLLTQVVEALIKVLPKPQRAALEAKGSPAEIADACAGAMRFADGPLPDALSEAVAVLYEVAIPSTAWQPASIPAHLRLRFVVTDHAGKEIGADRDLPALVQRLEGRIRKAREAEARAGAPATESGSPTDLRRVFAEAIREETAYCLDALPEWNGLVKWYTQSPSLGTQADLREQMTLLIAERLFLEGQPGSLSQSEIEDRLTQHRGRIAVVAREVGQVLARMLEPRFNVARRLAGGTNRLWAESIADIREQAAFLMPAGFLSQVPWERLRQYPRYVGTMWHRILSLREDGSKVEQPQLKVVLPLWKKFTGWVAAAMSDEARRLAELDEARAVAVTKGAVPQARRAAPRINLDAAAWAMRPGALPPEVERFRWAVEELRVAQFNPSQAGKSAMTAAEAERLWPGRG